MSEQLEKKDLITTIAAIDSALEHIAGLGDPGPGSYDDDLKKLKDKIVRMITWQPVEIPYCKCSRPDWNHSYTNVFCNHCYGFTSTFKI